MNKQQALLELANGKRIRHKYFTSDEWMERGGRGIVFEEGCTCTQDEFWENRTDETWDSGWSIVPRNDLELTNEVVDGVSNFLTGTCDMSDTTQADLVVEVAEKQGIEISLADAEKLTETECFCKALAEHCFLCEFCGWWCCVSEMDEHPEIEGECCSECRQNAEED